MLNCLHSFKTKQTWISYRLWENKDFCDVVMPSKDIKIFEFNQYQKSDNLITPSIIYADLKSLSKKVNGFKNNPEKSSTTKIGEQIPSGYSMSAIWIFDDIENKHDAYRGEYYMKTFCELLIAKRKK